MEFLFMALGAFCIYIIWLVARMQPPTPPVRNGVTRWKAFHVCRQCDQEVSENDMMYNHGVCPNCGHSSGSTVVNCKTKSRRWITKDGVRVCEIK